MILIYIILFFLLLRIYISVKHPFWSRQPVLHVYNIYYLLFKRGIVHKTIPKIDYKYFDSSIQIYNKTNINIDNFIRNNWCKNKNWKPYTKNIDRVAIYKINNEIAGVICCEFLNYNNKKIAYIDYLCVKKSYRKKKISPKLIYNIFLKIYKNDDIKIFLFKWEHKSMNIIPLCIYNSYLFDKIHFKITINNLKIIEITERLLYEIDRDNNFKEKILRNNFNYFPSN